MKSYEFYDSKFQQAYADGQAQAQKDHPDIVAARHQEYEAMLKKYE